MLKYRNTIWKNEISELAHNATETVW